jgi:hypothetical protein
MLSDKQKIYFGNYGNNASGGEISAWRRDARSIHIFAFLHGPRKTGGREKQNLPRVVKVAREAMVRCQPRTSINWLAASVINRDFIITQ